MTPTIKVLLFVASILAVIDYAVYVGKSADLTQQFSQNIAVAKQTAAQCSAAVAEKAANLKADVTGRALALCHQAKDEAFDAESLLLLGKLMKANEKASKSVADSDSATGLITCGKEQCH